MPIDRRIVAYHEAAHAVASVRYQLNPCTVTIKPNRKLGSAGTASDLDAWTSSPSLGTSAASSNGYLTSLYAGYAAQIRIDPAHKKTAWLQAGADRRDATAVPFFRRKRESYWVSRAKRFVSIPKNWNAIEFVAKDLLERETLAGDEVDILVGIADGNPESRESLINLRRMQFVHPVIEATKKCGLSPAEEWSVIYDKSGAPTAVADLLYDEKVVVLVREAPCYDDRLPPRDGRLKRKLKGLGYRLVEISSRKMDPGMKKLAQLLKR